MSEVKYQAPKLTRYGKLSEFIEAGSVALATGDVTGDGVPDTLFDTDGDGFGDLVVGGANGGQTPVTSADTFIGFGLGLAGYDADGDGLPGIIDLDAFGSPLVIARITEDFRNSSNESPADDGWDDPARD